MANFPSGLTGADIARELLFRPRLLERPFGNTPPPSPDTIQLSACSGVSAPAEELRFASLAT